MNESVLTETTNVIEARKCIKYLQDRPKTEMVGLGLIFGVPGLGKTRFVKRFALSNNHIYMHLEATGTNRSFVCSLLQSLHYKFNLSETSQRGTTNQLFEQCLDILQNAPNTVIVIDEIDYAFRKAGLLGTIRDIADMTLAIVILVGMQNAKNELLCANAHYFDRCNSFYEFIALTLADTQLVCKEVPTVTIQKPLVALIHKQTAGNFRKTIKFLYSIEQKAKKMSQTSMDISDYTIKGSH